MIEVVTKVLGDLLPHSAFTVPFPLNFALFSLKTHGNLRSDLSSPT